MVHIIPLTANSSVAITVLLLLLLSGAQIALDDARDVAVGVDLHAGPVGAGNADDVGAVAVLQLELALNGVPEDLI